MISSVKQTPAGHPDNGLAERRARIAELGLTLHGPFEAASICALNALAVLELALGSLDRIQQILRVTGFVACRPSFTQQPVVVDGARRVLYSIFGEAGRHVRSATGVAALPHGAAVEIELSVALIS